MADDILKWIRNVSALNDEQLKQEIDLVHQSSIKAFARALAKVRRPEVDRKLCTSSLSQLYCLVLLELSPTPFLSAPKSQT